MLVENDIIKNKAYYRFILVKLEHSIFLRNILYNIGGLYFRQGDFNQALVKYEIVLFIQTQLRLFNTLSNDHLVLKTHLYVGLIYYYFRNYLDYTQHVDNIVIKLKSRLINNIKLFEYELKEYDDYKVVEFSNETNNKYSVNFKWFSPLKLAYNVSIGKYLMQMAREYHKKGDLVEALNNYHGAREEFKNKLNFLNTKLKCCIKFHQCIKNWA